MYDNVSHYISDRASGNDQSKEIRSVLITINIFTLKTPIKLSKNSRSNRISLALRFSLALTVCES